ncbi:hypothetical protein TNCV_710421 [Trichonephila clavipes]|uniref:Uncharacterized protein n=1 Tax=Trichonephila clavipes TaxID=2585209 RepID=A0A8X6V2A2_TRICX|nr:hypothetical protein TNCV_710421 [Trichonephila clavipes]
MKGGFLQTFLANERKIAMTVRNHQNTFTHSRMSGKLEEGRNLTSVTQELGIDYIVVSRTWKASEKTGRAWLSYQTLVIRRNYPSTRMCVYSEHLEYAFGARLAERTYPPKNTRQLTLELFEVWQILPQELLINLVSCPPRWF